MTTILSDLFFKSSIKESGALDWKAFSGALLDASRNGVTALDLEGKAVVSNRIARRVFGIYPGTSLKNTMPDFWPHVEKTLSDHKYRFEIPVSRGKESFLSRVNPILWKGDYLGVLVIFEDTTELERVTRKMLSYQELSRELDTIINSSNDGLWICDAQAVVTRVNPASESINNVKARDMIGRRMDELVTEGFVDRSITLEVIETQRKTVRLQQTHEGRKLIVSGNPVFDRSGKLIRVVIKERDITELDDLRRELEEQEVIQNQFKHQMLEMQVGELASKKIISHSPNYAKVLRKAMKVSGVDTTVLLLGESGVGKGMVADIIHKYSGRSKQPMIKINCGAIPESLVESELFGYEKGAFTGAQNKGKPGFFELADQGILFLDEIAELPLSSQVKLLRFLEDSTVTRVGATRGRQVDIRILAATNKNLEEMVEKGSFRLDLYYRLNVIPIRIPPIRERQECILPLLRHYIDSFKAKLKVKREFKLTSRALDALQSYAYPGNVRELMNICERIVVMSEKEKIGVGDLPRNVVNSGKPGTLSREDLMGEVSLKERLDQVEREMIRDALRRYGTQQNAAKALKVNQSTIARKIAKYDIK